MVLLSGMLIIHSQEGRQPVKVQVEIRAIRVQPLKVTVSTLGTTMPYRISNLAAVQDGLVLSVLFKDGQIVRKNQELVLLDNTILKAQQLEKKAECDRLDAELRRLKVGYLPEEIAEKKAIYDVAKASLEQANSEWQRKEELYRNKNISKSEWEQAKFNRQVCQAVVDRDLAAWELLKNGYRVELIAATQAELNRAQAQLSEVDYWLKKNTILAPFDGIILTKQVEEGEWVTTGKTVTTLLDISKIKIAIFVAEKYMGLVKPGLKGKITLDALPGQEFEALIEEIIPQASAQSRNFELRLVMDNPVAPDDPSHLRHVIQPGMFCRVFGILREEESALMIHSDAIVRQQNQTYAIKAKTIKDEQGSKVIPEYVLITLGARNGDWFELRDLVPKLDQGDKVVVTNQESIKNEPGAYELIVVREY